ncbi:Ribokinase-like protein [Phanerochaete sordida]|uniref:Ribokinase-like protein n=1 Tax=Phanerochaete sordida TaxID=48140 RepID=A0A9P3FYP8_9APHY|nr:Ribokinase-like protein [Phanerochaete sordida]
MASTPVAPPRRHFVTLGMFIIDMFSFLDAQGAPTGKTLPPQIGGGGTYANIGARIWLAPDRLGMIVDRGHDFPEDVQRKLDSFGTEMWMYRDDPSRGTTRALNEYKGEYRGFRYLTPRVRLTPRDLIDTPLEQPATIHFICSPARAQAIVSEIKESSGWSPTTIFEPIPDRCVPEELPALREVLASISILSPNADEALSLLSTPGEPTKATIEEAARRFVDMGVGPDGKGAVIIRSGAMGAYILTRERGGRWVPAFWRPEDAAKIVDVTGAGNSFLGGLSAGLLLANGDVYEATLYATISPSFIIEQEGLPTLTRNIGDDGAIIELWNGDTPQRRLEDLRARIK